MLKVNDKAGNMLAVSQRVKWHTMGNDFYGLVFKISDKWTITHPNGVNTQTKTPQVEILWDNGEVSKWEEWQCLDLEVVE